MKACLILLLTIFLIGCISLETVPQSSKLTDTSEKKIKSDGKVIEMYLSYSNGEDSNLYKNQSNNSNFALETSVAFYLSDTFKFKAVNLKPTEYQKFTEPENFKNDFVMTVSVIEKTVDPESLGQMFLRGISFGFVKQNLQKKIEYKIDLKDVKSGRTYQVSSNIEAIYQYQAPMLIIPVNLDNHPFTTGKQVEMHMDKLKTLAQRIIE